MHEAAPSITSHLDINILIILHQLGNPFDQCTLIFDLMGNLYIYNVCTYIFLFTHIQAYVLSNI